MWLFYYKTCTKLNAPNYMPRYEIRRSPVQGTPLSITVRPIFTPGDRIHDVYEGTSGELKRQVVRAIIRNNPLFSNTRNIENVTGGVQMTNIDSSAACKFEHVSVENITSDLFEAMFDRVTGQGSNQELNIYEVEWSFLINPNSLARGSLKKWKNSRKYEGLIVYDTEEFPCGVVSLAVGLVFADEEYKAWRSKIHPGKSKNHLFNTLCRQINSLCGKDEMTVQELLDVVHLPNFKNKRIVIIRPRDKNWTRGSAVGEDYVFNKDIKLDKTIYILYDILQKHFVYCRFPKAFTVSTYDSKRKFCHDCLASWNPEASTCGCGDGKIEKKPPKRKLCDECNEWYIPTNKHTCYMYDCPGCNGLHRKSEENVTSRCPLTIQPVKMTKWFDFEGEKKEDTIYDLIEGTQTDKGDEPEPFALIVYDIESARCLVPDSYSEEYEQDDNGRFVLRDGRVKVTEGKKYRQIPNFVAAKVIGGEMITFQGTDEFVEWVTKYNEGRVVCLAHNGSGYDTRLIFESAVKIFPGEDEISTTLSGGRIMSMTLGKLTRFQDSMLHIKGSLKALAKGFNLDLEKGFFPHLFNIEENFDYVGPLPSREYFDLSFMLNKPGELKEFDKWYEEWEGDWNFQHELKK